MLVERRGNLHGTVAATEGVRWTQHGHIVGAMTYYHRRTSHLHDGEESLTPSRDSVSLEEKGLSKILPFLLAPYLPVPLPSEVKVSRPKELGS